MKTIIKWMLCVAILGLSGCGNIKTAEVGIRTDANGKPSTFIITSAGDRMDDKTALRAASKSFPRQVKQPLKNHLYKIRVNIRHDPEPMFKSEGKKT
ncbi:hypothetical protein [Shinella kummerowiae]|uniref:hypothetical protein n=1 Tax=Shinella kummerowiae TaxID=417745 RepID=UPI0021B64843|nr:hypothetical protein [Shinella kummerowiae]MCT7667012.1 hypothetical protein [Shinella kummerowiae]